MSSRCYLVIVQHLSSSELPRKSLPLSLFVLLHPQLLYSLVTRTPCGLDVQFL